MPAKRLVLVTGATGTLGTAVCRQLIEQNYYPVAIARNEMDLKYLAAQHPDKMYTFACDVGDSKHINDLFDQEFIQNNTLHGVIACAGILEMEHTEASSVESWDRTINTNLSGTYYIFRASIEHMKKTGGLLIAIGSRWADGAAKAAAYSASKSALRGLINAMQKEFAGTAIRPVLISPGSIQSNMSGSVNTTTAKLDILHADDVAETIMHVLRSPQRIIFSEITIKAYNYDLTDEYRT